MATTDFRCPHCQFMLSADVEQIGSSADCPNCSQELTVPFMFGAVLDTSQVDAIYASLPLTRRFGAWIGTIASMINHMGQVEGQEPDMSLLERYHLAMSLTRLRLAGIEQINANLDHAIDDAKAFVEGL